MFIRQFQPAFRPFTHGNSDMICQSHKQGVNLIRFIRKHVDNISIYLTRRLTHHIKVAETSYYIILTMIELEVALEITLTTCRVSNRAPGIKNHI